jgi:hypothetical protein
MSKRARGTLEALRDLPAQVKAESEEYTPKRSGKRGASDGSGNESKKTRRKATERPTVSRGGREHRAGPLTARDAAAARLPAGPPAAWGAAVGRLRPNALIARPGAPTPAAN